MDTNRMNSAAEARYGCPIEVTIAVLGGKWKCVILWWLRRDFKTFGELRQLVLGITPKVLTQQLRELEDAGLVDRQSHREKPPRVEYSLTSDGETLIPITDLMCEWGKTYLRETRFSWLNVAALQVLVASQDMVLVKTLTAALEPYGAQVLCVSSEGEALMLWQQPQPDALVIDLTINTEEGFRLIHQMRALELQRDRPIPAIALINKNSVEQQQALRAGFQIRITKPIDLTELIAAIASLTNRQHR